MASALINKLEILVDDWIRRVLDDLAKKAGKVITASWQGYEGRLGTARLNTSGSIVKAPVVGDGAGSPIGAKCFYDGKKIELPARVKRKQKKRNNRGIEQGILKKHGKRRGSAVDSPVVYVGLEGNQFTSFSIQAGNPNCPSVWISTPNGEIEVRGPFITAGTERQTIIDQFKDENFWLDAYPEPPVNGFYVTPPMRKFGDDSLTVDDDVCYTPYIHRYVVLPELNLSLRVWWWDGSPVEFSGQNSSISSIYTYPKCVSSFQILTLKYQSAIGEATFCGAGRAEILPTPNLSAIMSSEDLASVPYDVGDRIWMRPLRDCEINPDPDNPCQGGIYGYYPVDYITNGSDDLTSVRLNGCNIFITDKFIAPNVAPWAGTPYVGKVILKGVPEPNGSGNPGNAAQYGYMERSLVPNQSVDHDVESLAEGFSTIPNDYLREDILSPSDWVVSDSSSNEPPEPPEPYGNWYNSFITAKDLWHYSSRNGVIWGYNLQAINRLKDTETWATGFESVSTNVSRVGTLNTSSTTMCRERTLSQMTDPAAPEEGTDPQPKDPYEHAQYVIIRYKLDTVEKTVQTEVFDGVEFSPDCISSWGAWPCGYYDPDLEESLESYLWEDDPRVLDGLTGKGVQISSYHYSASTGRLWFVDELSPTSSFPFTEMYYATIPEDVEVGSMEFAQWVQDATDGTLDIGDYSEIIEFPTAPLSAIQPYISNQPGWPSAGQPVSTSILPVQRYSPKAGPPGLELASPEQYGQP